MKTHQVTFTIGEVVVLRNMLSRYVDLLDHDWKFAGQFTVPEIFEIREAYKKLSYSQLNERKEDNGDEEKEEKESSS